MRTTKAPSPERVASGLSGGRLWVLITSNEQCSSPESQACAKGHG